MRDWLALKSESADLSAMVAKNNSVQMQQVKRMSVGEFFETYEQVIKEHKRLEEQMNKNGK